MKRIYLIMLLLSIICGFSVPAWADFINMGGGLIYDTNLNVTWLQDANYAMSSGYDADGRLSYADAQAFVASLTVSGVSGWRLPTFDPNNARPDTPTSTNEFGSLWAVLEGYPAVFGSIDENTDVSPFYNLPAQYVPFDPSNIWYWTGATDGADEAWRQTMT